MFPQPLQRRRPAAPSPLNVGPCISAIVVGFSAASLRNVGADIGVGGMNAVSLGESGRLEFVKFR